MKDLGIPHIPKVHQAFETHWQTHQNDYIKRYINRENSFIPNLLPETAVQLSTPELLKILHQRIDSRLFTLALNPDYRVASPIANHTSPDWIKTVNMVGINVRTIGSFWNILKYILTIPDAQSSVHILPIWEVGVVASLYGISSWHINPEFFDEELYHNIPSLDTVEKQLKVVVNLLHAMGRTVGMDVIPHTDRYSQIVLANPQYFEWLQRRDLDIIDHRANLHEDVQSVIMQFLAKHGAAVALHYPKQHTEFFDNDNFDENGRALVLFGEHRDYKGREKRRIALVQYLYDYGFEPVPATMAPPYRGLEVDPEEANKAIDDDGRVWRDYKITKPEGMSRVFGPLTRFKLYERLEDNQNWAIDFLHPRKEVWRYVAQQYHKIQADYNFDFMRGDMSHVQMRPEGVPHRTGIFYDILKTIKNHIQHHTPYFAYFAETFIAPAGTMAYGDEMDHLEFSDADTTLGDLQSVPVGTDDFLQRFRYYCDILETRTVTPNFTMMTGDKDDPRFDKFYLSGNEARFFTGIFMGNMPSYMGLGFECRDVHHQPAPNEHYTKLYVFKITVGHKATFGPYVWGKNAFLFHQLSRIKLYAEAVAPLIAGRAVRWLLPPDPTGWRKFIAWTHQTDSNTIHTPQFVFIANFDTTNDLHNLKIPAFGSTNHLILDFSTVHFIDEEDNRMEYNGINYHLELLQAGECRVYQVEQ